MFDLHLPDNLIDSLHKLPGDAPEAIVNNNFIANPFLDRLGFSLQERIPQFKTGWGGDVVDYALRHNLDTDIFLSTKANPHVLVELKGRDINLAPATPKYKSTVEQIKRYLLAPNCQTVQWGIITNSKHIQLFRKHGKTIHPATACLEITPDNIVEIVEQIRQKIENTPKALTVAVYNNKGGVGKTTTVINLAAVLTRHRKKVLVVDFDPNQRDLSNSLGIKSGNKSLFDCLKDKKDTISLKEVIIPYTKHDRGGKSLSFDVVPVDDRLFELNEDDLHKEFSFYSLRKKLESLKYDYDYILIDAPPGWIFCNISAIYASDVVLIPTKHNNVFSLENAAVTIQKYIPEVQKIRQEKTKGIEWGATALPIFFNGEQITDAAKVKAKKAIDCIITQADTKSQFDLKSYFYPHFKTGSNNKIFELPRNAWIADAAFDKIPAVYKNIIAYSYYTELAKEYFLQ